MISMVYDLSRLQVQLKLQSTLLTMEQRVTKDKTIALGMLGKYES